jgi:hypothetical protein
MGALELTVEDGPSRLKGDQTEAEKEDYDSKQQLVTPKEEPARVKD